MRVFNTCNVPREIEVQNKHNGKKDQVILAPGPGSIDDPYVIDPKMVPVYKAWLKKFDDEGHTFSEIDGSPTKHTEEPGRTAKGQKTVRLDNNLTGEGVKVVPQGEAVDRAKE